MSISEAIVISLKKEIRTIFPEVSNVYSRPRKQGVELPCFQVRIVNSSQFRLFANQWWYTMRVVVNYLSDGPSHEHLQDIRERLLFDMDEVPFAESVPFDGLLRAEDPTAELINDDIVFSAKYTVLVKRDRPEEPIMEELEKHPIYTDIPTYEEVVDPIRNPDPGMWRWRKNPDNPYISEEEEGLMEEIENDKDIIP